MKEVYEKAVDDHKNKRFDDAETGYWAILKETPDHAQVNYLMAGLMLEIREYSDAEAFAEKAIKAEEGNANYILCLGQALLNQNKYEEAASAFEEVFKLDAENYEALSSLGKVYRKLNRHDEAVKIYEQAFKLEPKEAQSHVNLGEVFVEQGKLDWAASAFKTALKHNGEYVPALLGNGLVLLKQGEDTEAEQFLRKAYDINNHNPQAHYHLALLFFSRKKYDWVEDAMKTALRLDPRFLPAYDMMGKVMEVKSEYVASEAAYRKAWFIAPDDVGIMEDLGNATILSGSYYYGVGMFKGALDDNPDSVLCHSSLGLLYALLGEFANSANELKSFYELVLLDGKEYSVEGCEKDFDVPQPDPGGDIGLISQLDESSVGNIPLGYQLEDRKVDGLIEVQAAYEHYNEIIKNAGEGDAESQYKLSLLLDHGYIWGKPNYELALKWLLKAAHAGIVDAQLRAGFVYAIGRGTEVNEAEACAWFNLALKGGCEYAQAFLSKLGDVPAPAVSASKTTSGAAVKTQQASSAPAVSAIKFKPKITLPQGTVAPRPENFFTGIFWGPVDHGKFHNGLQTCFNELNPEGIFSSDNLITFGRQLGFMSDPDFQKAYKDNIETDVEKGIVWRTHVLAWAAENGMRREGDFVECGCYKGVSSKILCDYLDFEKYDKTFYLYDLFYHEESMDHHAMPEHGEGLYERTIKRFEDYPNVKIVKGMIPESFEEAVPEKIAFLHIDMNEAGAELAALEHLWDRLVPGGMLVLDDYGWGGYYINQKFKEDPFFAERGYKVCELPTGQGLVLK